MIQFLRPGFRSGTIPKIYARLRKASRKAYWTGNWKSCSKQLTNLHHASEAIRRFVDRELLEILHESRTWADRSIATGEIRLGCNRILIELYCPELSEESLWLAFEEQSGWLVASIHKRGWADNLTYQQRHALASALAGFYKMAGVDLVREQIEARLAPDSPGYEVTDEALVVWPRQNGPQLVFPLAQLAESRRTRRRTITVSRRAGAVGLLGHAHLLAPLGRNLGTRSPGQHRKHQVLEDLSLLPS